MFDTWDKRARNKVYYYKSKLLTKKHIFEELHLQRKRGGIRRENLWKASKRRHDVEENKGYTIEMKRLLLIQKVHHSEQSYRKDVKGTVLTSRSDRGSRYRKWNMTITIFFWRLCKGPPHSHKRLNFASDTGVDKKFFVMAGKFSFRNWTAKTSQGQSLLVRMFILALDKVYWPTHNAREIHLECVTGVRDRECVCVRARVCCVIKTIKER